LIAGVCEGSYCQSFSQICGNTPSNEQISEIRKIIARRKVQIEQGIDAYFKEKKTKFSIEENWLILKLFFGKD